jgi:molecular chaperone GrpE
MSEDDTADDNDTDPAAKGDASAANAAADPNTNTNDILSSPAFLKRKLEVLESDIATAEEELVAATERKEVAKEEWGPQLEALQREVR